MYCMVLGHRNNRKKMKTSTQHQSRTKKKTTHKKEDNNRRFQKHMQTATKKTVYKSISHNPNTEKLSSPSLQYTRSPHTYLLVVKRPFKETLHYKKDIVISTIIVFRALSALLSKLVLISTAISREASICKSRKCKGLQKTREMRKRTEREEKNEHKRRIATSCTSATTTATSSRNCYSQCHKQCIDLL
jgi:hypothetical protein